jgi:hypothetical protein
MYNRLTQSIRLYLPISNHFTKTLVRSLHIEHGHVGQQTLLSIIRQNYWSISAKNIVKLVTKQCASNPSHTLYTKSWAIYLPRESWPIISSSTLKWMWTTLVRFCLKSTDALLLKLTLPFSFAWPQKRYTSS